MTDVVFIYLFFSATQKNVKQIQHFDKKNKIANRVFCTTYFFLSATLFPIVFRTITELYADKTNNNFYKNSL